VHDASRVRGAQRRGDARGQRDARWDLDGIGRPAEPLRERLPLEPLHRQVELPVARVAVRHVADDGVVPQVLQDLRFAREATRGLVVVDAQPLDRHRLARHDVAGSVHRAHGAGPDEPFELEAIGDDLAAGHPFSVSNAAQLG
jgi:hypothetical protein